jgi:alanine-glyoxylate transaminase/serine-glyoxylate transaminase/serine-pyruvate transaminase
MRMAVTRGRQFFQNPGPTNIPDRILRAMDRAALDFMGGEFRAIAEECYEGLRRVFKTDQAMIVYAANGHGAWEAAMVNVFSPGDKVLILESGWFSLNWGKLAEELGLVVETLPGDWRVGVDPAAVETRLREDKRQTIKAVMLVHNDTSTGVANRCAEIRRAIDDAGHEALFMVDVISSLGSIDFRMDEWQADVVVGGSQKGLMLPPGMSFTGASAKAIKAAETATLPRIYWDWRRLMTGMRQTSFNGTAPVHLIYGLQETLRMLAEEGLDQVFARHHRLAEATRRAVRAWRRNNGPEIFAADPRVQSNSTASTSRSAAGLAISAGASSGSAIWAISTSR